MVIVINVYFLAINIIYFCSDCCLDRNYNTSLYGNCNLTFCNYRDVLERVKDKNFKKIGCYYREKNICNRHIYKLLMSRYCNIKKDKEIKKDHIKKHKNQYTSMYIGTIGEI